MAKSAGKVYLVSGKTGEDLATWTSRQAGDTLGFDAVGLGDVDGDGHDDFIAAELAYVLGRGRVACLSGVTGSTLWSTSGISLGDATMFGRFAGRSAASRG